MISRKSLKVPVCILLSLLMLVDFAVFTPAPAKALDTKSVLVGAGVGAAAGVGITLAAPAIGGAIGAAGGIAGIGTAIVGGVAAVAGGIVGAAGAVVGAVGAAIGAVGGFIAGIIASPLFIPALVIIGAAVLGYYLYRRHQRNREEQQGASAPSDGGFFPGADEIYVTPGEYEVADVIPPGDVPPVNVGNSPVIEIGGAADEVIIGDEPPPSIAVQPEPQAPTEPAGPVAQPAESIDEAHQRYLAAYQRYTMLATNSGGADPAEIRQALEEYRAAYNHYQTLKAASGN